MNEPDWAQKAAKEIAKHVVWIDKLEQSTENSIAAIIRARYQERDEFPDNCFTINLPVEGGSAPPVGKQPPTYGERLDACASDPDGLPATPLQEVPSPEINDGSTPSETPCPSCGGRMTNGVISCPGGRPGCLVLHYGLRCSNCGKQWH